MQDSLLINLNWFIEVAATNITNAIGHSDLQSGARLYLYKRERVIRRDLVESSSFRTNSLIEGSVN